MDPNMPGMATSGGNAVLIDRALIIWFALTAWSALYVAWDAFTNNPELRVMRWGWVLVTLYTGPVGAALYLLTCKGPQPVAHERFVAPRWKQALGSTIHGMAGDTTGIIVAAAITVALGFPLWLATLSGYIIGFACGLPIFQVPFMRATIGGSYLAAARRSVLPEWLSLNAVMAGMIPTMVILMSRDMRAIEVTSVRFWGVMSLATLVGLVVAYPVNWWLVASGLKRGMGTERILGKVGHGLAAERAMTASPAGTSNSPSAAPTPAAAMPLSGPDTPDMAGP